MCPKPPEVVGEAFYYLKIEVYLYILLVETEQQNLSWDFGQGNICCCLYWVQQSFWHIDSVATGLNFTQVKYSKCFEAWTSWAVNLQVMTSWAVSSQVVTIQHFPFSRRQKVSVLSNANVEQIPGPLPVSTGKLEFMLKAVSSAAAKQKISSLKWTHTVLVQCLYATLQRNRNQEQKTIDHVICFLASARWFSHILLSLVSKLLRNRDHSSFLESKPNAFHLSRSFACYASSFLPSGCTFGPA